MKFIHTGDWHIGKLVHGIHMTKDQTIILDAFVKLIEEEGPDCVIIAGDLYDRSVPPVEAVELLDDVLSRIVMGLKIPVIAVAGNHDSPDRLGFGSKILKDNGLYIRGNLEASIEPIILKDEHGPVKFHPIPYTEPAIVRSVYGDDNVKTHDSAMAKILESIELSGRNVCVGHGFITGVEALETSESERPLSIGGSDYVSVDYFEGFDYVALGHLHRPQKVKWDKVRYAGSLMKYSFSEAIQKKSVTIVEMGKDGEVEITQKSLVPKRDMRVIKGNMEQLMDKNIYEKTNTEDYIMAVLTDRGELIDPIGQLRSIYPNILRLEREDYGREVGQVGSSAGGDFVRKDPYDLFVEFYENVSGEAMTDNQFEVVQSMFNQMNKAMRME